MQRPMIGITLDSQEEGSYSRFPWYAIRRNYGEAVTAAGGAPIMLPHEPDLVGAYLDRISGLVVTGGAFDVDPALFGETARHPSVTLKPRRTEFERAFRRTRNHARSASRSSFSPTGVRKLASAFLRAMRSGAASR